MNKQLRQMKRLMAKKMGYKMGLRVRVPSKSASHSLHKAKIDKKSLPRIKPHPHYKDPKFAQLSIEDFEKEYL